MGQHIARQLHHLGNTSMELSPSAPGVGSAKAAMFRVWTLCSVADGMGDSGRIYIVVGMSQGTAIPRFIPKNLGDAC